MASLLARNLSNKFNINRMNGSFVQSLIHARRSYYSGDRYNGYVSFFQPEELFGFVVREDLPDREYYFHSTDLHTRNVPRVRPLQQVEFTIVEGRGGNYIARDVTGPNQVDLEFNHPNMRLPQSERTQLLSQLPNGLHERHKGVVVSVHADGNGGLIVPDRLNFNAVSFNKSELQCTGFERIDRFSEVEFFVRAGRFDNQRDRAVCITRPGGGLITAERKDIGSRRRQLGAMYNSQDMKAKVPSDFQKNRQRGLVTRFDHDKLFGFITCVDDPDADTIFVHADDCHIAGKRILRRFMEVEFVKVTEESTGKSKALHVTAPNETVIHSITDNHYLPRDLTTLQLENNNDTRYQGQIINVKRGSSFLLIKPNERGYLPVIGFKNNIQRLGRLDAQAGDCVEFTIAKDNHPKEDHQQHDDDHVGDDTHSSDEQQQQPHEFALGRAINVTAPGGYPLMFERGRYGQYLRKRMKLPHSNRDLPECPIESNKEYIGFVANYNLNTKQGSIEVEAPDGVRYRAIKFSLDDAILSNEQSADGRINSGYLVRFNIEATEMTEDEKQLEEQGRVILTQKAVNVRSLDLDYLQLKEININQDNTNMANDQSNFSQQNQQFNRQQNRQPRRNNYQQQQQQQQQYYDTQGQQQEDDDLWGDDDDIDTSRTKRL